MLKNQNQKLFTDNGCVQYLTMVENRWFKVPTCKMLVQKLMLKNLLTTVFYRRQVLVGKLHVQQRITSQHIIKWQKRIHFSKNQIFNGLFN